MRKKKIKEAKKLVGETAEDSYEIRFHPKLLRNQRGNLFLSFRTQYLHAGYKGALQLAKKEVMG